METILKSTSFLVIAILYCACSGTHTKDQTVYIPSFDYKQQSTAQPGSAAVTFAIVNASYAENKNLDTEPIFVDFKKSMGLDFQEILSSRGFTVRGPFGSYEEMAFPDKKGSDLILQPTIEIKVDPQNITSNKVFLSELYTLEGDVRIGGRVTLSLMESLTKERMWFKSIELPSTAFHFEGTFGYQDGAQMVLDSKDPGIGNPLAKTLEKFYQTVMDATWKYLDPEEMKIIKNQAEEIKKKKVY